MLYVGGWSIYYANINSQLDKARCITHTPRFDIHSNFYAGFSKDKLEYPA